MDEGIRIDLPWYNLPMHTTALRCYPGSRWCSNRDECLGTFPDRDVSQGRRATHLARVICGPDSLGS
jgi:hypothetical protein